MDSSYCCMPILSIFVLYFLLLHKGLDFQHRVLEFIRGLYLYLVNVWCSTFISILLDKSLICYNESWVKILSHLLYKSNFLISLYENRGNWWFFLCFVCLINSLVVSFLPNPIKYSTIFSSVSKLRLWLSRQKTRWK